MSGSRGSDLSTTYKNAVLIYNPVAGYLKDKRRGRLDSALRLLRDSGHQVSAVPTSRAGTAGGIAQDCIREGADLILVAGGDGTVNEALNGIVPSRVPLSILPGGTANVLACELGIAGQMEKTAREVGEWTPKRMAVGVLRTRGGALSRYFLLMAGVGFDAHIVSRVNLKLKDRHGKLAYWIAGLGELRHRLQEFDVSTGGGSFRCTFALASRVRNYGGTVEIARGASLLRDDFEVVLITARTPFHLLKHFAGVLSHRLKNMKGVVTVRARSIELYGPADAWIRVQVDGEAAGRLPASIEIVPDALTLLVPPAFQG